MASSSKSKSKAASSSSSSSRTFSSMLGSMDTDAALAKLGLSREQLASHTTQMRQFLSSDTTFIPKQPPSHSTHNSLPAFPVAPEPHQHRGMSRSRSLDVVGGSGQQPLAAAPPAPGPASQPAQTPSRTRKASDADLVLPEDRPSKRQRAEKHQPAHRQQPSAVPPRVLYPPPTAHPSLPPMGNNPSKFMVHEDVFSVAPHPPSMTASSSKSSHPPNKLSSSTSALPASSSSMPAPTHRRTSGSIEGVPKKAQSDPQSTTAPVVSNTHAGPKAKPNPAQARGIAPPPKPSKTNNKPPHLMQQQHPGVAMGMPMPMPYGLPPPAGSSAATGFVPPPMMGAPAYPGASIPAPPHMAAFTSGKLPPGYKWVSIDPPKLPFTLPPPPYTLTKPTASFPALIGNALRAAQHGALSLAEIFSYLALAYPYFQSSTPPDAWKVAVKQTLESCPAFALVKPDKTKLPQGTPVPPSMWMIREDHKKYFVDGEYTKPAQEKSKTPSVVAASSSPIKREPDASSDVEATVPRKKPSSSSSSHSTSSGSRRSSQEESSASSLPEPSSSKQPTAPVLAPPKPKPAPSITGPSKAPSSTKKAKVPPQPQFYPGMPGMPMFAPYPGFFMPGMPGMPPGMPGMPMMPGFMPPMPAQTPKKGSRNQNFAAPHPHFMPMGMPMPGMPIPGMPMPAPPRPAAVAPKPKKQVQPQSQRVPPPAAPTTVADSDEEMADATEPEADLPARTPSPVPKVRGLRAHGTAPPDLSPSTRSPGRKMPPPPAVAQDRHAPRSRPPIIPSSSPVNSKKLMAMLNGGEESDSSSSEDERDPELARRLQMHTHNSAAGDLAPATPLQAAATLSLGSGRLRASASGSAGATASLMERMLDAQASPLRGMQRPTTGRTPAGSPAVDIARAMRTPSLMERTLARKAAEIRAKKLHGTPPVRTPAPVDEDDDVTEEPTPSPEKALPLPFVFVEQSKLPTISPMAIMMPGYLEGLQGPVAIRQAEDADEEDEGFRSSNTSPGVPLAQMLAKQKGTVRKSQFSRYDAPMALEESPELDSDGARKAAPKKQKRRPKKNNWGSKKKRKSTASKAAGGDQEYVEEHEDYDEQGDEDDGGDIELADPQPMPQLASDEDEADYQMLDMSNLGPIPDRFTTPEPTFAQPADHASSPFRTPLGPRNHGAGSSSAALPHSKSESDLRQLGFGLRDHAREKDMGGPILAPSAGFESPGRSANIFRTPNLYATPKRGSTSATMFAGLSPFKTPVHAEDPFSANRMLEAQMAALSPMRGVGMDGMPLTSPGGTIVDPYGMSSSDAYGGFGGYLRSPGMVWP